MFDEHWNKSVEVCGLVTLDDLVVSLPNRSLDPTNSFVMSSEDILAYGDNIKALWHTHPSNDPNLSIADYKSFIQYPNYLHIVVVQNGYVVYADSIVLIREKVLS
jgi:proteasome lid subunit RPN8/RPN11